jgi:DNA-directed RNA polymerase specialized sigma24 family protein
MDSDFARERRHLLALAFRILGSQADAEDAVQECWIKFSSADMSAIRNVSAWLTAVVRRKRVTEYEMVADPLRLAQMEITK